MRWLLLTPLLIVPFFLSQPAPLGKVEESQETTFAEIDEQGTVLRVIVADQEFIDSGAVGDPSRWVQTFKNGSRNTYAGPGFTFDRNRNAFILPRPAVEATFDAQKLQWILERKPVVATSTRL